MKMKTSTESRAINNDENRVNKTITNNQNRLNQNEVKLPQLIWEGGFLWKIPSDGKSKPAVRKITIKRAHGPSLTSVRAHIISTKGKLVATATQKYIHNPPTIQWHSVDDTGAIVSTKEVAIDSNSYLSPGHSTGPFTELISLGGFVPKAELCFSLVTGTRTLDLAAGSTFDAENWKQAMHAILSIANTSRSVQNTISATFLEKGPKSPLKPERKPLSDLPTMLLSPAAEPSHTPSFAVHAPTASPIISQQQQKSAEFISAVMNTSDPKYADNLDKLLFAAANAGQCSEVEVIFMARKYVDTFDSVSNETVLFIACRMGNVELIVLCLRYGAQIDPYSSLPLSELNKGCLLQTALHVCVEKCRFECAVILLSHAARSMSDITLTNQPNSKGQLALHMAVANDDVPMIDLLIRHGANSSRLDINGASVLHVAAACNSLSTLEALLDQGLDAVIDAVDNDGNTPLYLAAMGGHLSSVKILLESAARTDIKNNLEITARQIALAKGFKNILRLLAEFDDHNNKSFQRVSPLRRSLGSVIQSPQLSHLNSANSRSNSDRFNRLLSQSSGKSHVSHREHFGNNKSSGGPLVAQSIEIAKIPVLKARRITELVVPDQQDSDDDDYDDSGDVRRTDDSSDSKPFIEIFTFFSLVWIVYLSEERYPYYWCGALGHSQWEDPRQHGLTAAAAMIAIANSSVGQHLRSPALSSLSETRLNNFDCSNKFSNNSHDNFNQNHQIDGSNWMKTAASHSVRSALTETDSFPASLNASPIDHNPSKHNMLPMSTIPQQQAPLQFQNLSQSDGELPALTRASSNRDREDSATDLLRQRVIDLCAQSQQNKSHHNSRSYYNLNDEPAMSQTAPASSSRPRVADSTRNSRLPKHEYGTPIRQIQIESLQPSEPTSPPSSTGAVVVAQLCNGHRPRFRTPKNNRRPFEIIDPGNKPNHPLRMEAQVQKVNQKIKSLGQANVPIDDQIADDKMISNQSNVRKRRIKTEVVWALSSYSLLNIMMIIVIVMLSYMIYYTIRCSGLTAWVPILTWSRLEVRLQAHQSYERQTVLDLDTNTFSISFNRNADLYMPHSTSSIYSRVYQIFSTITEIESSSEQTQENCDALTLGNIITSIPTSDTTSHTHETRHVISEAYAMESTIIQMPTSPVLLFNLPDRLAESDQRSVLITEGSIATDAIAVSLTDLCSYTKTLEPQVAQIERSLNSKFHYDADDEDEQGKVATQHLDRDNGQQQTQNESGYTPTDQATTPRHEGTAVGRMIRSVFQTMGRLTGNTANVIRTVLRVVTQLFQITPADID